MFARRRHRSNRRPAFRKAISECLETRVLLSAAYTIVDLTPLAGNVSSSGLAVDSVGDVVGKSVDSGGNSTATLWPAGQSAVGLFGQNGVANALDGSNFIVGQAFNPSLNTTEAAIWTSASTPTPVGILPGDVRSTALGVDKFGDVIGVSFDSSNNEHAFLATPNGGIQQLDPSNLGFYLNSYADGINNMGEIVGDAQFSSNGNFEAFRFSPSSGTQFGLIPGGSYSFGTAINSVGDVVGNGDAGGTSIANEAFLWTASSPNPQGIGSFNNLELTVPTGVNVADQIVGYGYDGTNSTAFLWSNGTYHKLDGMIPANSGWTELSQATGINNAGQIAGFGIINGETHAFLLTPVASSTSVPTGVISAQDVTFSGGSTQTVTVVYTDGSASINTSSIDTSDITVSGPKGALAVTGVSVSGSGNSVVATYSVAAPSGTFSFADNGTYSIALNSNSVSDTNNVGNPSAFGSFHVNIAFSASDALSATVFAADVNVIGSSSTLAFVLYIDTVADIDPSTLSGSNLTVSGPGGAATVTLDRSAPVGTNQAILAEYTITAPGGVFTAANVGTYTVSLSGGSVKDVDGNPVQATGTSFSVNDIEDTNFGSTPQGGGSATGSINVTFQAQDLLIGRNGEILLVGSQSASFGQSQGVLELLSADGSIDTTFNSTGIVTTPANLNAQFFSAAIESNGDIVAAGTSNGSFFVARYLPNGVLDTSFGSSGYATATFPSGSAIAYNVSVAGDNSLVLSGTANSVFALARFTPQGALDSNFNPGGVDDSTFPAGGQMTLATGAAGLISSAVLQGDGKILGVGSSGASVIAFRLNPDGSRDSTFASNGLLTVSQLVSQDSDGSAEGQGIALTSGGNILVCGEPAGGGLAAVRITPTGQIDTTFGNAGISVANFGGTNENADAVLVNPNTGEYVLIGTTNAGSVNQLAIAAFNPDGTPDTSFGTSGNGRVSLPVPGASSTSRTRAYHPQLSDFGIGTLQNGNVIVGGTSNQASVVRRLQSTGITKAPSLMVGKIGKKNFKLAPITLKDGTVVTVTVTGGGGTASTLDNQIALSLSGAPNVTIKTKGGTGALTLSNVTINGNLTSLTAPAATLAGTLSITGKGGRITLGNISGTVRGNAGISSLTARNLTGTISTGAALGTVKLANVSGTIAAGGIISNLTAVSLTSSTILAGTNLGADGVIGGANTDIYGLGAILNLKVLGAVATSFIGAGVNPADLIYGNGNDALVGAKSKIGALTIKGGIDAGSRFESGSFPTVAHLPGEVKSKTDAHFKQLA